MPMFYTPKPRQFHYTPRFYDPEKERWEEMKRKYAAEHAESSEGVSDAELEYFERKVAEMERAEKGKCKKLVFADLFRKRKMPEFHYTPRFQGGREGAPEVQPTQVEEKYNEANLKKRIKIRRRFDVGDTEYMKPVSGGRIVLYVLLTCLLLYWILF